MSTILCMSTVAVSLSFVYVYRLCMSTARVCFPLLDICGSCVSTVCVYLLFMYVYHSCMSTVAVSLSFVDIYRLCMSNVPLCLLVVYVICISSQGPGQADTMGKVQHYVHNPINHWIYFDNRYWHEIFLPYTAEEKRNRRVKQFLC